MIINYQTRRSINLRLLPFYQSKVSSSSYVNVNCVKCLKYQFYHPIDHIWLEHYLVEDTCSLDQKIILMIINN